MSVLKQSTQPLVPATEQDLIDERMELIVTIFIATLVAVAVLIAWPKSHPIGAVLVWIIFFTGLSLEPFLCKDVRRFDRRLECERRFSS